MAIDPRISLDVNVPSNTPALQLFNSALNSASNRGIAQQQAARQAELQPFRQQLLEAQVAGAPIQNQLAEQTVASNQQTLDANRDKQRFGNLLQFSQQLKPELALAAQTGDTSRILGALNRRKDGLIAQGLDTVETDETIADIQAGNFDRVSNNIANLESIAAGNQPKQRAFAPQASAPITDPVTGQVSTPVFDPNTQTTRLVPIEGAIQETPTQKAEREQRAAQTTADVDVDTTQRKETIKKTVARTSELKKEFSERRRLAARSKRRIAEAQKLAEKATQGLAGASKVQLGRVFPGIDTSNEAALSGALKGLALDELQKFKGPTTDFEFRVTEDIAGALGDGAAANRARLSSLNRAAWFADRESQQFNEHVKGGHDPDEFFFNFNELVTPRKGGKSYSLQSLQDTAVANNISIDEVIKRLSK